MKMTNQNANIRFQTSFKELFEQARSKQNTSWFNDAIADYQQAKEISLAANEILAACDCSTQIGICLTSLSRFDEALLLHQENLRIYWRRKKYDYAAASYNNIANMYRMKDELKLASKFQLKALQYFEKAKDELHTAMCLTNVAAIEFSLKKYQSSIRHDLTALATFEKLQQKELVAHVRTCLANSYCATQQYDSAIEHILATEVWANGADNLYYQAMSCFIRGVILGFTKKYNEAVAEYTRAAEKFKYLGNQYFFAMALYNLSNNLIHIGTPETAMPFLETAAETLRSINNNQLLAVVNMYLAEVFQYTGHREHARELYETNKQIFIGNRNFERIHAIEARMILLTAEAGNFDPGHSEITETLHDLKSANYNDETIWNYIVFWLAQYSKIDQATDAFTYANQDRSRSKIANITYSQALARLAIQLETHLLHGDPKKLPTLFRTGRGQSMPAFYHVLFSHLTARQVSRLSREAFYFQLIRSKLIDNGVAEEWLPLPAHWITVECDKF